MAAWPKFRTNETGFMMKMKPVSLPVNVVVGQRGAGADCSHRDQTLEFIEWRIGEARDRRDVIADRRIGDGIVAVADRLVRRAHSRIAAL